MSFKVQFRSCNYKFADGAKYTMHGNWGQSPVIDLGLTDPERNAVLTLLRQRGQRRISHDDRVQVTLPDGACVTVHLVGLLANKTCFDGIVVAPELTPALANFVFDLAKAGNFMFAMESFPRPIVISEKQHRVMVLTFPGVRIATSATQLWQLVGPSTAKETPAEDAPPEGPPVEEAKSPEPAAE
ncbi:hypothetical protein [Limnoglobus roseus]|uniref:Uncharacterized protein n=1 Tax=Limnoglobus roseus TaxID=2598579 RepID=A0A5C1AAY8_9BACT|nr:hypothetical protein [Limnoglobus roseus]QEL16391.1 hypothetical protein PX52LOC_03344 [Limnoglobus roseus]